MNCLALNPDDDKAISNGLMSLNYDANSLAEQIAEAHRSAGHWYATHYPQRKRRFLNQRKADRTLRVAYLSSDFRRHPVAHFILPVLQQHNRQQVRPYVYYTSPVRDEFTALAEKSSHQFVHAWDFDNAALASRIEQDNIDILVDLNGATAGGRLPLLAARAAPVQMTWLGYPNSTGLNSVDYRIVDHITDPAPAADSLATETLFRLPGPFSVYDPIDSLPDVTPPPSLSSGRITFGSFNNLAKYNDNLLECWSELLRRTPQAVLLLKDPSFEMTAVKERMLVWLERHGIPRQRVELLGFMASREEQFNAYSLIDIHLDTFPYNGTTTTCEALLMGVPVVTPSNTPERMRISSPSLRWLTNCDVPVRRRSPAST